MAAHSYGSGRCMTGVMGLYDTVVLDTSVELPRFPEALDPHQLRWQTKDLSRPGGETFQISGDGRLLRQETAYREKTDTEKQTEAHDHGFDTWDDYVTAAHSRNPTDPDSDLPAIVRSVVKVDSWWVDHNFHGSFEFYATSPTNSGYDITWSYEARFSRGALDELVFLGDRDGTAPDDVER